MAEGAGSEKSYYEKFYPGPFKPVPGLSESGPMPDGEPGLLEGHNSTIGAEEWPYESEGEGSKYPAARKK